MTNEDKENLHTQQFDTGVGWPSGEDCKPRIELIRTGRKFGWRLNVQILSHDVYKFRTHYVGQTVGCVKQWTTCHHCTNGVNERWSGYLGCWWIDQQKFAIIDITGGIAPHLRLYKEQHGTLRTAILTVERERNKSTKPVEVRGLRPCKPEQLPNTLPEFDVVDQLFRIWQTKIPKELSREREIQKTHAIQLNQILNHTAATQPRTKDELAIQALAETIPIRKQA